MAHNEQPMRLIAALAPQLILGVLVLLFVRESRLSRQEAGELSIELKEALSRRELTATAETRKIVASLRAIRNDFKRLQRSGLRKADSSDARLVVDTSEPEDELDLAQAETQGRTTMILPDLPFGVPVADIVKSGDVQEILSNEQYNPEGVEFGRVDRLRASNILVHARTEMERLESQIALDLAMEIDRMRAEGDYELWPSNVPPEPTGPDTLSVGESAENGYVRMYYFPREFHPEIFSMRGQINESAKNSVRQLFAMLKSE